MSISPFESYLCHRFLAFVAVGILGVSCAQKPQQPDIDYGNSNLQTPEPPPIDQQQTVSQESAFEKKYEQLKNDLIYFTTATDKAKDIARVFLGSKELLSKLRIWNSDLPDNPAEGTKVRVPKVELNVKTEFISKHILKQNKEELYEYFSKKKVTRSHKVAKDETLQKISLKYYGTLRRWPEIYLLNHKIIKTPDLIKVGTKLNLTD